MEDSSIPIQINNETPLVDNQVKNSRVDPGEKFEKKKFFSVSEEIY